jgi:hypothetical protein
VIKLVKHPADSGHDHLFEQEGYIISGNEAADFMHNNELDEDYQLYLNYVMGIL